LAGFRLSILKPFRSGVQFRNPNPSKSSTLSRPYAQNRHIAALGSFSALIPDLELLRLSLFNVSGRWSLFSHTVDQATGIRKAQLPLSVIGYGRTAPMAVIKTIAAFAGSDLQLTKGLKYRGMIPDSRE
jgi:hypothetical protein